MAQSVRTISILIVEPDPALREALTSLMSNGGFATTAVVDSARALDALCESKFDVLLSTLDFGPGRPGGVELGRVAKLLHPGTVIYLLGDNPDELQLARQAGVGAVFTRPITQDVANAAARERQAC